MKVLFIARRYPPSVGGMERFAFDLSGALGKKVELQKITWGGSNKWLPIILPLFFIRGFWRLTRNSDIDIIHMQDAVQAPVGWLLHKIFRKPYIVVAHGLDITYQNRLYQLVILPFVRRANMVVSISAATKKEVDARRVNPEKSKVISLGIHDDYGDPRPDRTTLAKQIDHKLIDRKLLLTTGRLVKRKGVEWFIDNVLPELIKKDKSVLYLVAGEGIQREAIEQTIKKTKTQNNVMMLGRVSNETRSLLYQSCDIFVMPNIAVPGDMEGFGIVAHEAAVAGLPVVASNLEGIADALTHNKNGVLLKERDSNAYIRNIRKLLNDEVERKKTGEKARKYTLDNFSWSKIAGRYINVYKSLHKERMNGAKDV